MYVESLQITSFGALSGFTLDLSDGINVVLGNNEAGKSTVAEFIRYVFYGFNSKADRERYQSFNSEVVAGSVILRDGDKRYRVERRTAGTKDNCYIYDLDNGSTCYEGRVPGEVFFGMPVGLFVGSTFVGQTGGSRIDGKSTSELLDNLLFAADEGVNVKKSLKKLDEGRVALLHKNKKGGRIFELKGSLSELEGRLDKARDNGVEVLTLENKIKDYESKLEYEESSAAELSRQLEDVRLKRARERKERLNALENAFNDATGAYREHREKYTRNGFFPDQSYLESLKDCASKVIGCDERIANVEKRLDNLNREMEKDREERERAEAALKSQISSVAAKRSVAVAVAVLCCVGFIAGTVIAALLLITQSTAAGVGIGVLSALLFGCMIGGFVLVNRFSAEIRELESHALKHDDGFKVRLDVLREDLADGRAEREKYSLALNDLCSRWSIKYSKNALQEMLSVIDEGRRLENELEKARVAYVQMKSDTEQALADEPEDDGRELNIPENFDLKATERNLSIIENMIRIKNISLKDFAVKLATLKASSESSSELLSRIEELKGEIDTLEERYEAYALASESIEKAATVMRESVSPRLSNGAGVRMEGLTDGRYNELTVGSDFSVTFRAEAGDGHVTKDDSFMSAGTSDVAYVSLRLALAELIRSGEGRPPMIFDESFSRLDDGRLKKMLRLISEEKGQSIILTSNKREGTLLEREGIPFNSINI